MLFYSLQRSPHETFKLFASALSSRKPQEASAYPDKIPLHSFVYSLRDAACPGIISVGFRNLYHTLPDPRTNNPGPVGWGVPERRSARVDSKKVRGRR